MRVLAWCYYRKPVGGRGEGPFSSPAGLCSALLLGEVLWCLRKGVNAKWLAKLAPALCQASLQKTQRSRAVLLLGAHSRASVFLYRFCVAIKKENYPEYMPSNIFSDSAKQIFRQPGHTIYLLPTVVVCNLLPCELEFYVKGMPISGTLKPGKEAALHTADTAQNVELGKAAWRARGNATVCGRHKRWLSL